MWIWIGMTLLAALLVITGYAMLMKDPEDEYLDVHPDDEW